MTGKYFGMKPAFAALALLGFCCAAQAQGQRDIPAPETQAGKDALPAGDNGAFPPPPAAAGQTALPADGSGANGADVSRDGQTPPQNLPQQDGGAALWPSVANQAQQEAAPQATMPQTAAEPQAAADPQVLLHTLQSQVEVLSGRVDALERALQQMKDGKNKAAPAVTASPAAAARSDGDDETYAAPQDANADALYQLGRDFMAQSRYAQAAAVWRSFGARFATDSRAAAAAFALGKCYAARGLYAQAAEAYLDMQAQHKESPLAPQALLKLAQCMANLQDIQTACATLDRLAQQYSQADAALLEQGTRESARLQCP